MIDISATDTITDIFNFTDKWPISDILADIWPIPIKPISRVVDTDIHFANTDISVSVSDI